MLKPRQHNSNVVVEMMHDGYYRASCSDYGGLTASGSTYDEAERNLLTLIDERVEQLGPTHSVAILMEEDEVPAHEEI